MCYGMHYYLVNETRNCHTRKLPLCRESRRTFSSLHLFTFAVNPDMTGTDIVV